MPCDRDRRVWGWDHNCLVRIGGLSLALSAWLGWAGLSAREPTDATISTLVVDPDTAPPQVLAALPRVGPTLARRIVTARHEASFRSLDDFDRRVKGIGPVTLESLRPHLHIESDSPSEAQVEATHGP